MFENFNSPKNQTKMMMTHYYPTTNTTSISTINYNNNNDIITTTTNSNSNKRKHSTNTNNNDTNHSNLIYSSKPVHSEYLHAKCLLHIYYKVDLNSVIDDHFAKSLAKPVKQASKVPKLSHQTTTSSHSDLYNWPYYHTHHSNTAQSNYIQDPWSAYHHYSAYQYSNGQTSLKTTEDSPLFNYNYNPTQVTATTDQYCSYASSDAGLFDYAASTNVVKAAASAAAAAAVATNQYLSYQHHRYHPTQAFNHFADLTKSTQSVQDCRRANTYMPHLSYTGLDFTEASSFKDTQSNSYGTSLWY